MNDSFDAHVAIFYTKHRLLCSEACTIVGARIPIQVDVGFGDAITPGPHRELLIHLHADHLHEMSGGTRSFDFRVSSSRRAIAGTEDSLRRYIVSLENGQPNYDEMAPALAAAVKQQLLAIMAAIRKVGDFKSIAYEGLDRNGLDVYDAAFEHGHLEWHIAPLSADGKVVRRSFRQLD